jgi:Tfp pilus assembly protein PilN
VRFDYLRDAPPDAIDRLRVISNTPQARPMLSFLAMSVIVTACAWGLQAAHLHEADAQLERARQLLDENTAAIVRVKAKILALRRLTEIDRRLREIRISGAVTAVRVTHIADQLPGRMWLTELASTTEGDDMQGRVVGLDQLGFLLARIPMMKLLEVRAAGESDDRLLEFHTRVSRQ